MKTRLFYYLFAAMFAVGFVGCTNDNDGTDGGGEVKSEKTYTQIQIQDKHGLFTRADAEEGATDPEKNFSTTSLKLFVFRAEGAGLCEYAFDATDLGFVETSTPGKYISNKLQISSGSRYVYVFADPKNLITAPTVDTTTRLDFEKSLIAANFASATANNPDNIADVTTVNPTLPGAFLLGSLWSATVNVPADGTELSPKPLELTMGRSAAKIKLESVAKGSATELKGDFIETAANIKWKVNSVAKKSYLVGQWAGGTTLPGTPGSYDIPVQSAMHTEAYNAADYQDYGGVTPLASDWDNAAIKTIGTNNWYYAVENTSERSNISDWTTHIQFRIKYQPKYGAGGEVYKVDGGLVVTAVEADKPANGDFWLYKFTPGQGQPGEGIERIMIFSHNPVQADLTAGVGTLTLVGKYELGMVYYSFPIRERSDSFVNRVLRNHSYKINVTSIQKLGEFEPGKIPPIDFGSLTYINAYITVLPWSGVTLNEEIIIKEHCMFLTFI